MRSRLLLCGVAASGCAGVLSYWNPIGQRLSFFDQLKERGNVKENVMLTITSLLSILLFSIHLAGDIVHGIEPGTATNLPAVPILVVWLYGTLVLAERRSGQLIMLLGSLLAVAVPALHLRGAGVGGAFAKSSGALLFIWTLFALGVTGTFSLILLARGLRRPRALAPEVQP